MRRFPIPNALRAALFPEISDGPVRDRHSSRRHAIAWLFAWGAGALLLLLRQSGVGALDTIWAEDGSVFLQGALDTPFSESWSEPYAGYLHLVPRILAEGIAILPPASWAAVLAIVSALVSAGVALFVVAATRGHIPDLRLRALFGGLVLLLPIAGLEVINSIANLHWYLNLAAFWALFWNPRGEGRRALLVGMVFVATASHPFTILLAPVAMLRALSLRGWTGWAPLVVMGLAASAQAIAMLTNPVPRALPGIEHAIDTVRWFGFFVVETGLLGIRFRNLVFDTAGIGLPVALSVAVFGALLVPLLKRPWHECALPLLCGLYSAVFFLTPAVLNGAAPPRYAVAPQLLLWAAILVTMSHGIERLGRLRGFQMAVLAWLVALCVVDFELENDRSPGPRWSDTLPRAERHCDVSAEHHPIPVAPLVHPDSRHAGQWILVIPCERLGDDPERVALSAES